jgi:hypothetical protein
VKSDGLRAIPTASLYIVEYCCNSTASVEGHKAIRLIGGSAGDFMIDYLATFCRCNTFRAKSATANGAIEKRRLELMRARCVRVVASCILSIGHQANPNVRHSATSRVRGVLGFPNDGQVRSSEAQELVINSSSPLCPGEGIDGNTPCAHFLPPDTQLRF